MIFLIHYWGFIRKICNFLLKNYIFLLISNLRIKYFYLIYTKFFCAILEIVELYVELKGKKKLKNEFYNEGTDLGLTCWPKNQNWAFRSKLCYLLHNKSFSFPLWTRRLIPFIHLQGAIVLLWCRCFFSSSFDIALQSLCCFIHTVSHSSDSHVYKAFSTYTLLGPECITY